MAVVNDKRRFIFLAEPHTASRAVRDALLKVEGSYKAGSHHLPIGEILKRTRHRKRSYYTTFSVVRNPADIMVSLWLQSSMYKNHTELLADYIRRWGKRKPTPFFFRHANDSDCIIHYENLQDELNSLLQKLQAQSIQLEVVGGTEGKAPWFRYYSASDLCFMLSNYPEVAQWGYTEAIRTQIGVELT